MVRQRRRRWIPLTIIGAVAASILVMPASSARVGGHQGGRTLLFVPSFSSNVVTVFNAGTGRRVASIGINANGACCAYATPNQRKVFIVDGLSPFATRIDVNTLKVDHVTRLAGTWGDRGAPVPRSGKLFWLDEIPQGNVQSINVKTGQVVHTYPSIGDAFSVSHNGRWLFEANTSKNIGGSAAYPGALVVRSARTGKVAGSVKLPAAAGIGQLPLGVFVTPDDRQVFIETVDPTARSLLYVINVRHPTHPRFVRTITVGATALVPAFNPSGRQLWVPNAGSGTISVVSTGKDKVLRTIDVGPFVSNVVLDGRTVFVGESTVAPNAATSLALTLAGVIVGAAITPGTGYTKNRALIDLPGRVVQYDARTYRPLHKPALQLPSVSFVMELVHARH
jgi:YVTN family beta-propeller protein